MHSDQNDTLTLFLWSVAHGDRVGVQGTNRATLICPEATCIGVRRGPYSGYQTPLTVTQQPVVVINNFYIALYVLPQTLTTARYPLPTTTGDRSTTPRALSLAASIFLW
jgi:hypothetical protein